MHAAYQHEVVKHTTIDPSKQGDNVENNFKHTLQQYYQMNLWADHAWLLTI